MGKADNFYHPLFTTIMITSKEEYLYYLEADKVALRIKKDKWYKIDVIFIYQKLLRKTEYWKNCKKGKLNFIYYLFLRYRLDRMAQRLGYTIPLNVFGPGLSIAHVGNIIIHPSAKIGENCRIHVGVNIGAVGGSMEAPSIGSNIYIAPGVKIYGKITIADGIAIGANSVVNKTFEEKNITIAGIPARKISEKGSKEHLVDATSILKKSK